VGPFPCGDAANATAVPIVPTASSPSIAISRLIAYLASLRKSRGRTVPSVTRKDPVRVRILRPAPKRFTNGALRTPEKPAWGGG
jgi:hypothetical protein